MELWIRSQNKGTLVKVEILGYTNGTICSYSGDNKITLGEYRSAERALEVLDEIENCLNQKFKLSGSYEELDIQLKTKMINGLYGYIYTMPEK